MMKQGILVFVLSVWTGCSVDPPAEESQAGIQLIPKPSSMTPGDGTFRMTESTRIKTDRDLLVQAEILRGFLSPASGYPLPVNEQSAGGNIIEMKLAKGSASPGEEGYELDITPEKVLLTAETPRGIFWGIQTIRQLLPKDILHESRMDSVRWMLPCLKIVDTPRFRWRGLMIDYSRTFWNKEITKKYIDALSFYKMNKLHMHLTDDQGWRVEISGYPALTDKGSKFDRSFHEPREREGFYSKADIRELIQYADERNVELIPEIEMPGHALAAIAAYPELSCTGEKVIIHPFGFGPSVHEEVLCPGKQATFRFIEEVLTEVSELFPSPYVHIGGDEVPKTKWKACPDCQKAIEKHGLKDEAELQSWFTQQVEKILRAKGKKLIGWDEIAEGGLSRTATVMFWRGNVDELSTLPGGGLLGSIIQANDAILSPTSHCYFDYSYETTPTKKVHAFEPLPGSVSKEAAGRLLGMQANFWSHLDRTEPRMDRQIFPRLLALAEVGWTDRQKDWSDFSMRLKGHYETLNLLKIKEAWIEPPTFALVPLAAGDSVEITFQRNDPVRGVTVRYTLDGSAPQITSPECIQAMRFAVPVTFRAGMFYGETRLGGEAAFSVTEAFHSSVQLKTQPSPKYGGSGATLTDGILGGTSYSSGAWIGFEGSDGEALVDMGRPKPIREISLGYLADANSWIFEPVEISFQVSLDGEGFQRVGNWSPETETWSPGTRVGRYAAPFMPVEARFVKVTARNRGTCPPNHPGKGAKAWLFLDEVLIR